jgi:predicted dehydrogenase
MLKVGVVGVGHLGRFHAEKYGLLKDVELVGVADLQKDRADAAAAKLGVKAFYHHRDLLGRVDAVSIVVPTVDHFQVAGDFLQAGAHILLEKPVTPTIDEADRLIDLAREKGLVFQVGHLERFNPAFMAARDLAGRPVFIEANRVSPFPKRGTDVDVVLDMMIHDLDIILHILGEEPVEVKAVGLPVLTSFVDVANARLEFPGGCVANLNASRAAVKTSRRMRVFHPDAFLSIDFGMRQVSVSRKARHCDPEAPEVVSEELEAPIHDALESEVRAFTASVIEGARPAVTGEDGRRALALALRIMEQINARLNDRPPISVTDA